MANIVGMYDNYYNKYQLIRFWTIGYQVYGYHTFYDGEMVLLVLRYNTIFDGTTQVITQYLHMNK